MSAMAEFVLILDNVHFNIFLDVLHPPPACTIHISFCHGEAHPLWSGEPLGMVVLLSMSFSFCFRSWALSRWSTDESVKITCHMHVIIGRAISPLRVVVHFPKLVQSCPVLGLQLQTLPFPLGNSFRGTAGPPAF